MHGHQPCARALPDDISSVRLGSGPEIGDGADSGPWSLPPTAEAGKVSSLTSLWVGCAEEHNFGFGTHAETDVVEQCS